MPRLVRLSRTLRTCIALTFRSLAQGHSMVTRGASLTTSRRTLPGMTTSLRVADPPARVAAHG